MEHLYDKLVKYSVSDYYGFHMPGHKRFAGFFVRKVRGLYGTLI